MAQTKPVIALAAGDPSGVSLELLAKLLADQEVRQAAHFIVIGDRRALNEGERIAKVSIDIPDWTGPGNAPDFSKGAVLLDLHNLDVASLTTGESSEAGGRFALQNFRKAQKLDPENMVISNNILMLSQAAQA